MKKAAARKQPNANTGRKTATLPRNPQTKPNGLPPHITRSLAFAIIGITVVGGFVLTPFPVACGITILAVLRLWIWQRQVAREEAETQV